MENIFDTWNWYVAGPLIGLFVPALLILRNKQFGISSSFLHLCNALLPSDRKSFLNYNKENDSWKFYFVIGIVIGSFTASNFLSTPEVNFLPEMYYSFSGYVKLLVGGVLVGFGTRYANGCTSGHSITGLALLQVSSLKATIAFFVGGLLLTYTIINF